MLHQSHLNFLSVLTLAITTTTNATCYAPNGTAITTDPCCDGTYSPCPSSVMCCALGRPVYHINECLGNGLCEDISTGWLWRESCTDPTWTNPGCLKLCVDEVYQVSDTGDAFVTACADGTYCCGNGNTTCCDLGQGYAIVDGEVIPKSLTNSIFGSSTLFSTGMSIATDSPITTGTAAKTSGTATTLAQAKSSSTSTTGIALGVGLGVGLPLTAAILALTVILARKQGGGTAVPAEQTQQQQQEVEKEEPKYVVTELPQRPAELQSIPHQPMTMPYQPGTIPYQPVAIAELPGERRIFEK